MSLVLRDAVVTADTAQEGGGITVAVGDSFVFEDSPSAAYEYDALGRLLVATDQGTWSGAGDDLLIGGLTTFDAGAYDGDGRVDAADYVLWRKNPAPADTEVLSFSAADKEGIPATMAEYALLLA